MKSMIGVVAGCVVTSSLASAGPLNPPAGAVAPTHKTLSEVEPRTPINADNTPGDANSTFKITQPGSYYLTGNIAGASGRHGIEIAASGVSIDLNGFDLAGVAGSLDGVSISASNLTNIRVRNGSVRNWGQDGVDLWNFSPTGCMVIELAASGNGGNGIAVGPRSTVALCNAVGNSSNGILSAAGCTNSACTAAGNTLQGIGADNGCTIAQCTAYQNTGDGIGVGNGSGVTDCTAYANTDDGISAAAGGTISNCTTRSNIDDGIFASSACAVSGCTSELNTGNGITVGDGCRVTGNACGHNGDGTTEGAGIRVVGDSNHVDGNTLNLPISGGHRRSIGFGRSSGGPSDAQGNVQTEVHG